MALSRWIVAIALSAGFTAHLHAADANSARALAATCFTCHGTEGRSVGGVPPSLAGQSKSSLLQSMREFRNGKRPATIMQQFVKGYTDSQLDEIAGYFASVNAVSGVPARSGNR